VELEAFIDARPAAPTAASHEALPVLRVLVIASAQISEFTRPPSFSRRSMFLPKIRTQT
jgi:hypothetical protein